MRIGGFAAIVAVGCARPQAESCKAYLECLIEYEPITFGAVLDSYGPDGSCWRESAEEAEQCEVACDVGLADSLCTPVAQANLQGCERFVTGLGECGDIDTSAYSDDDYCEAWGRYECDVSGYFDGLIAFLNCGGTGVVGDPPALPVCD